MITSLVLTAAGLLFLYFGADLLVNGATSLALRLGVSPLLAGLTIVAYGTSAPELSVSVSAAWLGKPDVAIANVVGSNIANIGLILGLAALLTPLTIHIKLLTLDVPLMVAFSLVTALFLSNGILSRVEGVLLTVGALVYTVFVIVRESREQNGVGEQISEVLPAVSGSLLRDVALILAGLALLIASGRALVTGAADLARMAGIEEAVIGLTLIAVGTSLPELATSLLAASRKMGDLAVGNVVGSNIFNILGVLGLSAVVSPLAQGSVGWTDIGMMVLLAIVLVPVVLTGRCISRAEGAFLFLIYVAYVWWLAVR